MDQTKNYFTTGLFVFIGLMMFGLIFYLLSGDDSMFSSKARLHSYFEETQGLMYGSVVSYSGINIGNVRNIVYDDEKRSLKVIYSVHEKYLPLIKQDSKAQLKTQGALGDRFIYLSQGSADAASVGEGGTVETSQSKDIFELAQEKVSSFPNLSPVTQKVIKLLDFLNSDEGLKGNLKELKTTIEEVKVAVKDLNKMDDHKKALKKLDSLMTKIDEGDGTLGRLINDPTLYNKVLNFVGGDEGTSSYLKELGRRSIESNE